MTELLQALQAEAQAYSEKLVGTLVEVGDNLGIVDSVVSVTAYDMTLNLVDYKGEVNRVTGQFSDIKELF